MICSGDLDPIILLFFLKGAGRKPAPSKMIEVVVWLPSEMLEWLDGQAGNSGGITERMAKNEQN